MENTIKIVENQLHLVIAKLSQLYDKLFQKLTNPILAPFTTIILTSNQCYLNLKKTAKSINEKFILIHRRFFRKYRYNVVGSIYVGISTNFVVLTQMYKLGLIRPNTPIVIVSCANLTNNNIVLYFNYRNNEELKELVVEVPPLVTRQLPKVTPKEIEGNRLNVKDILAILNPDGYEIVDKNEDYSTILDSALRMYRKEIELIIQQLRTLLLSKISLYLQRKRYTNMNKV